MAVSMQWYQGQLKTYGTVLPLINTTPLRRLILSSELEEIICARDNVESDDKHSLVFPGLHLNSPPCQL